MKYYIFDREKDDFMRDDDGEKVFFPSSEEVYCFLNGPCQFKDEWIDKNFFIMKACKILKVNEMPEFGASIAALASNQKEPEAVHGNEAEKEVITLSPEEHYHLALKWYSKGALDASEDGSIFRDGIDADFYDEYADEFGIK